MFSLFCKKRKVLSVAFILTLVGILTFGAVTTFAAEDLNAELQEEANDEQGKAADGEEGGGATGGGGGGDIKTTGDGQDMDTGDAINDIMDNARFLGAVSSIAWLTNITDHYFAMAITLVAFFIISAALLKNACAGAYCANSKFWDKVDDAHKKSEAYTLASLRNLKVDNISPAGIKDFILGIVPNIKAFTDFEDRDLEPKQYFMKAIPQMIACVIIGIFIYNGYYRDTASVVGRFGAETFERVMASADPIGLADRLYNTTGKPKTALDYDTTVAGKFQKAASNGMYTAILTKFSDVTEAGAKAELMSDCVNHTQEFYDAICGVHNVFSDDETGTDYWKNSVKAYVSATPVVAESSIVVNEDDGHATMSWAITSENFGLDSTKNAAEMGANYVVLHATFRRVAATKNGTTGSAAVGTINAAGARKMGTVVVNINAPMDNNNNIGACKVSFAGFRGIDKKTEYWDQTGAYATTITIKGGKITQDSVVGNLYTQNGGYYSVQWHVTAANVDENTVITPTYAVNGKTVTAAELNSSTTEKEE